LIQEPVKSRSKIKINFKKIILFNEAIKSKSTRYKSSINTYCIFANFSIRFLDVHRSFAFVEFESAEDAAHALDNMNNAEFYGKVLKINYSRPSINSAPKAGNVRRSRDLLRENSLHIQRS
jgi:RNA recognition motif-containing protein